MPVIKLTESWLSKYELPEGVDREWFWDQDEPGFGVLVGRRARTFSVKHRVDGKQVRVSIGQWQRPGAGDDKGQSWTVERAWKRARQLLGQMSSGEDPIAEERAARGGPTLAEAVELYLEQLESEGARPASIATVRREMVDRGDDDRAGSYVLEWLDRPLASITGADCRERHEKITKSNGPHVANRVMRQLRAVWNHVAREASAGTLKKAHGIASGTVFPACPTIAVRWNTERRGGMVDRRREPIAWSTLPAWREAVLKLSAVRRDYNLLALLTGIRRVDLATLRWDHVNLTKKPAAARVWNTAKKKHESVELPPHSLVRPNPKGGRERAFVIPLSKEAVEILELRQTENTKLGNDDGGWVFWTTSLKSKACAICAELGMPDHEAGGVVHLMEPKEKAEAIVSPHRLRDSYTSALAELKPALSPFVIDVLTNHRPPRGSVTAGYIGLDVEALAEAQQRATDFLVEKWTAKKTRKLALVK